MINLFRLRQQKLYLNAQVRKLNEQVKAYNVPVPKNAKNALEDANSIYSSYSVASNRLAFLVLSFIPFTSAFRLRMRCAVALATANTEIRKLETKITEQKSEQVKYHKVKSVRATKSDSELVVKTSPSPIGLDPYKRPTPLDDSYIGTLSRFRIPGFRI